MKSMLDSYWNIKVKFKYYQNSFNQSTNNKKKRILK